MKHILPILFIMIALMVSCNSNSKNQIDPGEAKQIDFSLEPKAEFSDLVESYYTVILETNQKSIINPIDEIKKIDDKLYLKTHLKLNSELLIFSEDGRFIRRFSKCGRGPDEYLSLADIQINPNNQNLLILDFSNQKIHEFDSNDKLLYSINTNCKARSFELAVHNNSFDYLINTGRTNNNAEYNYHMIRIDADGEQIKKYLPYKYSSTESTSGNRINKISEALFSLYKRNTDIIYHITEEGIKEKYRLNYPQPILPEEKDNLMYLAENNGNLKYSWNIIVKENQDFVYTRFINNNSFFLGLYDKKSLESSVVVAPSVPSKDIRSILLADTFCDEYLTFYATSDKAWDYLSAIDPEYNKHKDPEDYEKLKELTIYDNPVLFFVKFKPIR